MEDSILSIPIPPDRRRVTRSQSSWVESFEHERESYFLKTYIYPGPKAQLRGLFRNTFVAPSRAQREWRALEHLAEHGIQPRLAVALEERRRLGFLMKSRILSRAFGCEDLAHRLSQGSLCRSEVLSLARFVRKIHESGLRDPDLKARNILVAEHSDGLCFAKIDASSSRIVRPGRSFDRARVRDFVGLAMDLRALGQSPWQVLRFVVAQWFPEHRPRGIGKVIRKALARARG